MQFLNGKVKGPKGHGSSESLSENNILTDNTHVLREKERIDNLRRKHRSVSEQKERSYMNHQHADSSSRSATYQDDSYYTIYRDPLGSPNQESFRQYYDERGKAVDPVDLLFEDSRKQPISPTKIFKRLGKSKTVLPSIGAKELEYDHKGHAMDMQLNAMPSLTSISKDSTKYSRAREDALVDTVFEDLSFDTNTNTYRKPYESSKNSSRVASSSSASKETNAPEDQAASYSYFPGLPFSVWDCVSYVASFIPAIPVSDPSISESSTTDEDKPSTEKVTEDKALPAKPSLQTNKSLPPIPQRNSASRAMAKRMRNNINDFMTSEPPKVQRGLRDTVANDEKGTEDYYNRKFHPNFSRFQRSFRNEKASIEAGY